MSVFWMRLTFRYLDLSIDFAPALPDVNEDFRAVSEEVFAPYEVAIKLGRYSEESCERRLIEVYSRSVIMGSPSPKFENFDALEWQAFMLGHRDEFRRLQCMAETRAHWDQLEGFTDAHPSPGEPAG